MQRPVDLSSRRALVTGGSRNLGAAIARALAEAGAAVVVTYHRAEVEAQQVVTGFAHADQGAHGAVHMDATQPSSVERAVVAAEDVLGGPISILVNNAGPYEATPLIDLPINAWEETFTANVTAAYAAARMVAPSMRSHGWGRIVNVSAVSSFVRNRSIYSLSKQALNTLTECLAVELAPDVTVNAVAPGQIAESLDDLRAVNPEWADEVLAATPLQRLPTRSEIADAVTLLCSDTFGSMTGAIVPLDGGLRINRL